MPDGRTWDQLLAQYGTSHRSPVNRLCHTIGVPMIVASIPLFLVCMVGPGFWSVLTGLFVVGWILQFVGHAFEGSRRSF